MTDLSGYGELEIGGKKLAFKFGALAYRLFCKDRGLELHEIGSAFNDPYDMTELAYHAYVANERINGRQAEVTLDWFIEAVSDAGNILSEFNDMVMTSNLWGVKLSEYGKKKT